jgi:hypothetical protein
VTGARRKKALTGQTHLSAAEVAGWSNGSGDSPGGPWAKSWPWAGGFPAAISYFFFSSFFSVFSFFYGIFKIVPKQIKPIPKIF